MNGIRITVNGRPRTCNDVDPHVRLLGWLRGERLTGAKEGCAEGECGACAVLVARPDASGGARWIAINSCLPPAAAFDGQELVTAEGLAVAGVSGDARAGGAGPAEAAALADTSDVAPVARDGDDTAVTSAAALPTRAVALPATGIGAAPLHHLHPIQREMAERGGSQCGYCTPGFVCAMAAEYYRPGRASGSASPDHECAPNGFELDALSGNLCRCTGYRPIRDAAYALGAPDASDPFARRLETPAPPPIATRLERGGARFERPATLGDLLDRLREHPDAKLVAGATDTGVEVNIKHARPGVVLAIDRLDELRTVEVRDDAIEIGCALTISEIERELAGRVALLDALWPRIASRLIRNSATLGGNLGTASPIGDSPPALLALGARVVLASRDGERDVDLADFFTGYRETVREPGEVLRAVRIPLPVAEFAAFRKVSKRRFDDISSVAMGIAVRVEDGTIVEARIGLGGVAATPLRARATEAALEGEPLTSGTIDAAAAVLEGEGTPIDDARASARYRSAVLGGLLRSVADEWEVGR